MKKASHIHLQDVQSVYSGFEGKLWELIMGEQIHIGGLHSSMDLAGQAGVGAGMTGVDFCCCTGAGMRFLTRFRNVDFVVGVDATPRMVELGRERCAAEGLGERVEFVLADVCSSGLPSASADFIWGEDAWCYVEDKASLISEAARIVKAGGLVAFTDWMEGPEPLSDEEAARFLAFMKFPSLAELGDYRRLLEANGCEILVAENTGRYAPCIDLYLAMLDKQLTCDALKIVGFDMSVLEALGGEMKFTQELAHAGKLIQGLIVARKK
ncbi:MAG: methyltransferase domain-containing protein [Verrucomicrobiae bacterium]